MISLGNKRSSISDQAESNGFVQDLSNTCWAFARLQQPCDKLFELIIQEFGVTGVISSMAGESMEFHHFRWLFPYFSIQIVIDVSGISMMCPVFIGDFYHLPNVYRGFCCHVSWHRRVFGCSTKRCCSWCPSFWGCGSSMDLWWCMQCSPQQIEIQSQWLWLYPLATVSRTAFLRCWFSKMVLTLHEGVDKKRWWFRLIYCN